MAYNKRKFDGTHYTIEEYNKTNIQDLISNNNYKIFDSYISQLNTDKITLKDNHIYFNALITQETISTLITYIKTIIGNKHLFNNNNNNNNNKSNNNINIYIHITSNGGYLQYILDFIQFKTICNCQIISIIENYCNDTGFILAALCDYRIINKNAKCKLTKINCENSYFWNYFQQCVNDTQYISNFKDILYKILCESIDSKLTSHKLDIYFTNGCDWCSKKYKKLGLVDEIV
jgi:hypothetical protein